MNWNEMEIFKGIDLNDSFILSWSHGDNELIFELEASIWPESKYYKIPKKDEHACYKSARLTFKNTKEINGILKMSQVIPSTDANNETDYGNIEHLESNEEGFLVEGDFGQVSILGGEINFEFKET